MQAQPIRTSPDNAFGHATVTHRLPANIRNVIAVNPGFSSGVRTALEQLAREIADNAPLGTLPLPAWDAEQWNRELEPYRHERWHDTTWFFAETWAFRRILAATRYFETLQDPYGPMKNRELESGAPFLPVQRFATSDDPKIALNEALHLCIWGNKADISFALGGELDHSSGDRELLLADDSELAAGILAEATRPVHIVMDNSGAELAGDLVLAMTILQLTAAPVVLHLKFYPTYVSDTIIPDIYTFLAYGRSHTDPAVQSFCSEVGVAIEDGSITLAPDPYWCETRFLTDAPEHISRSLDDSSMVIIKGDFNYRRGMRDTIWPYGTDAPTAMGITRNLSPHLFLRTMKSDCLAGTDTEKTGTLDINEPGWRTAGRHGVIQLVL